MRAEAIGHVVRCFENDNIIHVSGKVNPADDIEVINTELALADLDTVNVRFIAYRRKPKVAIKTRKPSWRYWKMPAPAGKRRYAACAGLSAEEKAAVRYPELPDAKTNNVHRQRQRRRFETTRILTSA